MKKIKMDEVTKEEMRKRIAIYFYEERDEDLGELASQLILEFFLEELGPYIYNQGVEDAYIYTKDKAEDMLGLQIFRR